MRNSLEIIILIVKMIVVLMISAKLATPGLLKII